jgi:CheY-like chemotaxis protein
MALHLGEYWGLVARGPEQCEEPKIGEQEELPFPAPPCFDDGPPTEKTRRPVEILVVDDNNDDAILFQESLSGLEHIKLAQILDDPESAWDYLLKQGRFQNAATPDLVVLDIHMPRKTGLAFLEEIKAEPALWMLPVVMLSASRYEEDIWEAYRRGACTFVEKPPRIEWFRELAIRFANYWCHAAYLPGRDED